MSDERLQFESAQRYARQARRLRHRLRHEPGRLHRSLRALRQSTVVRVSVRDESQPRLSTVELLSGVPIGSLPLPLATPAADRFADLVRASLDGTTLRYSQRTALLRQAARSGVGRFEANLIIATIQHRAGHRPIDPNTPPASRWPWLIAGALQLAIISIIAWAWVVLQ